MRLHLPFFYSHTAVFLKFLLFCFTKIIKYSFSLWCSGTLYFLCVLHLKYMLQFYLVALMKTYFSGGKQYTCHADCAPVTTLTYCKVKKSIGMAVWLKPSNSVVSPSLSSAFLLRFLGCAIIVNVFLMYVFKFTRKYNFLQLIIVQ